MRSLIKNILLLLIFIVLISDESYAAKRRLLGPNMTMSWASSYLAIESGSIKVEDSTTWTYASAPGWFFDCMVNPYISVRSNWFFYPSAMNCKIQDMGDRMGEIPLHEIGFSVLRHFNIDHVNPWFGAGPFMQFSTVNDVNSYILHVILSAGFDYEVIEDTFFCPELMCGLGARIINSNESTVQIDVPTGKDFTSSGIVIFFKLGVAKSF